jgi:glycine/D-amino acid oxidase-like deaminating enzyme
MSADEIFILFPPRFPRLIMGAGFSGHSFKFGPLSGRILAELALFGKTEIPFADSFALASDSECV